jgi:hypothetical protein
VAGPSRRASSRFSILVDPEDFALLAESEASIEAAFAPLPLRYPTQSRPSSMFIPIDSTPGPSSSRPLSLPPRPIASIASPRSVSLPLPLPIPLPPLPSLIPNSASGSTLSRALSPIQDDDDLDKLPLSQPQSGQVEPPTSDYYHDFMSGALLGPTGRKREKTDSSIVTLSGVGLFPLPPPRVASSDSVQSLEEPAAEADLEETTDNEAIITEPCPGTSPTLSDMIEQMKIRQVSEDGAESEIGE